MYTSAPPCDPRSVDELINAALTEPDEDVAWNAVYVLHWRGSEEVLQRATALCRSACPMERRLGANILGQLGVPERTFPRECVLALLEMLDTETEAQAFESIFIAPSHLHDPKAIPAAIRFASHPDADVRHGVVLALTGQDDRAAIETLIRLTTDSDSDVRDWATFGLGAQSELDTPEIRDAMAARLDDPDDDTRGEALVGLARRRDPRVVAALKKELTGDSVGALAVEAAELIEAPELRAPLIALRERWDVDPGLLERAIAACNGTQNSNDHEVT